MTKTLTLSLACALLTPFSIVTAGTLASGIIYVDPLGNDETASPYDMAQPYQSLSAAIGVATSGDTILLRPGSSYSLTGQTTIAVALTIKGEPGTVVVPSAGAKLVFTATPKLYGITFDTGSDATTSGSDLIDIVGTTGAVISDCSFRGINGHCINGIGIKSARFEGLTFSHAYRGIYIGSTSGNLPQDIRIERCHASDMLSAGFKLQSPDGYNGDAGKGLSSGLYVSGCSASRCGTWDAVNKAWNDTAFEAWHGWTDVRFTDCTAEDSGFGFSVALCDNATLTACHTFGCPFAIEFAGGHDLKAIGCTLDGRITAQSQAIHSLPADTLVGFGGAFSVGDGANGVKILGCTIPIAVTGVAINVASNVGILGNTFGRCPVIVQNPCSNIAVNSNDFGPTVGLPGQPYDWLRLDTSPTYAGAPPTVLDTISFSRNRLRGGFTNQGITAYLNGGRIANLQIRDNVTDGAPPGGSYLQYVPGPISGGSITNISISGNLSATASNFVNSPLSSDTILLSGGSGQQTTTVSTSTGLDGSVRIISGTGVDSGGLLVLGALQGGFATIKALLKDGASNAKGDLSIGLRKNAGDATVTEVLGLISDGTVIAPKLKLSNLPTSAAGLPSGTVWNNSGILSIVP